MRKRFLNHFAMIAAVLSQFSSQCFASDNYNKPYEEFYNDFQLPIRSTDSWVLDKMGFTKLHKEGFTGKGVRILVLDTPVYTAHPGFKNEVIELHRFNEDGNDDCNPFLNERGESKHGTKVTGLIKSQAENVIGAAFGAEVRTIGIVNFNTFRWHTSGRSLIKKIDEFKPHIISISASLEWCLGDREARQFKDCIIRNDAVLVNGAGNGSGTFRMSPLQEKTLFIPFGPGDLAPIDDYVFDEKMKNRFILVGSGIHKEVLDPIEYKKDNAGNMMLKNWVRSYIPNDKMSGFKRDLELVYQQTQRLEEISHQLDDVLSKLNLNYSYLFDIEEESFKKSISECSLDGSKEDTIYLLQRKFRDHENKFFIEKLKPLFDAEPNFLGAYPCSYASFSYKRLDELELEKQKENRDKNVIPNFLNVTLKKMKLIPADTGESENFYLCPTSNRAGCLEELFITAVADKVPSLSFDTENEIATPTTERLFGATSFATPFVTSAIALLIEKYGVKPAKAVEMLFQNALKTTKPEVFGQGILSLSNL